MFEAREARGDPAGLLDELQRLSPDRRLERVRRGDLVRERLIELAAECERLSIDDLDRALAAGAMLVELARDVDDAAVGARVQRAWAQVLAYANRFDDALEALRESVRLAETSDDAVAAASARLGMLHALARLGRYEEAIAAGESARAIFLEVGEPVLAGRAEINLGVTHRMRSDPETALAYFDRAAPRLREQPVILAQLASNRAEALLDLNRFQEAEEGFLAALEGLRAAQLSRGAAIVQGNLADLMSRQGRFERALFHFEHARATLHRDQAAGDVARLEAEQAEAFAGSGLWEEAAECYATALPALDAHGLAWEATRARAGLGHALVELRQFERAETTLLDAARGFEALDHRVGLGRVRVTQGELALSRHRIGEARALFKEALSLLADRPADAALARHHLAALALLRGDLGEASATIDRVVRAAGELRLAPMLGDALHTRARVNAASGAADRMLADQRAAVREIERVRGSLPADRVRSAYMRRRGTVYEDLVRALLDLDDAASDAEAFDVVEQSRCRSLLDLVAGAIEPSLPSLDRTDGSPMAPIVHRVLELRAEINALYSRLWDVGPGATQRPADPRVQTRIDDCERELQVLESRLAGAEGLGGLFARPVRLAAVQDELSEGTMLVEYFLAGDELIAFVVDRDRCHVVRGLATGEALRERVEQMQFQIDRVMGYGLEAAQNNRGLLEASRRSLQGLHDLLIEPIQRLLGDSSRLVIVPHGPLHGMPFHALYDGTSHLIERFEVGYAPSASMLRHLRARRGAGRGGERRSLVVGVADEMAPRVEQELRLVSAVLNQPEVLDAQAATRDRVIQASSDADLVHFACHGRFTPRRPLSSGLRLADGWLTVRDVYGLRLDGSVVVLSGCDTGRSADAGGDDLVGLISGFMAAGASSLVMSLWPLPDRSGQEMMARAYELWQNEEREGGLAAAIRVAQREMLAERPHPIFWAPFIMVGRT